MARSIRRARGTQRGARRAASARRSPLRLAARSAPLRHVRARRGRAVRFLAVPCRPRLRVLASLTTLASIYPRDMPLLAVAYNFAMAHAGLASDVYPIPHEIYQHAELARLAHLQVAAPRDGVTVSEAGS